MFLGEPSELDGLRDNGRVGFDESLPILCTIEVIEGRNAFKFWKGNMEFLLEPLSKLEGAVAKVEPSEMASIIHIVIILT